MDQNILKDVCVIIRSSGERTEGLCRYSVLQNGIKEDQIFLIKNISPFSEALKEGYKKALVENKKYTIFIDADLIILKNSIKTMLLSISNYLPNFFINGLIYDYISGSIVSGGAHLYNTEYLKEAIDLIPEEKITRRPETFVAKKMQEKGYNNLYLNIPSAMHDFEQYYKKIFNSSFNKFIKFPEERWEMFKRFKKLKKENKDFEIAAMAFKYAVIRRDELKLDNQQFVSVFEKINVKEKEEIKEKDFPALYENLCKKLEADKNFYLLKGYDYNFKSKVRPIKRIIERLKIYISFKLFN